MLYPATFVVIMIIIIIITTKIAITTTILPLGQSAHTSSLFTSWRASPRRKKCLSTICTPGILSYQDMVGAGVCFDTKSGEIVGRTVSSMWWKISVWALFSKASKAETFMAMTTPTRTKLVTTLSAQQTQCSEERSRAVLTRRMFFPCRVVPSHSSWE